MSNPHSPAKRRSTRFQTWVWWLSLAYLAGLVVLFLIERFAAERTWWTLLVTYVSQRPLVYPLLLLLVLSLVARTWRAALVNVLAGILFLYAFAGVAGPHLPRTVPSGPRLRVMTLNADYFHLLDAEQVASFAAEQHLNLICLQEASPLRYGHLASDILRRLPGWQVVVQGQLSVLTRLPVHGWQFRPYTAGPRGALAVRLTVAGKPMTVVTTHFSTAYPQDKDRRNLATLAQHTEEAAALRAIEARELLTFVGQQQTPVLVAGDFEYAAAGTAVSRTGAAAHGFLCRGRLRDRLLLPIRSAPLSY